MSEFLKNLGPYLVYCAHFICISEDTDAVSYLPGWESTFQKIHKTGSMTSENMKDNHVILPSY